MISQHLEHIVRRSLETALLGDMEGAGNIHKGGIHGHFHRVAVPHQPIEDQSGDDGVVEVVGFILVDGAEIPAEHIPLIPGHLDLVFDAVLARDNGGQGELVALVDLIGNIQGFLIFFRYIPEILPAQAVVMGGNQVDIGSEPLHHRVVPFGVLLHAAGYQADALIYRFHGLGKLNRGIGIFRRGLVFHLPGAVHLVAQPPEFHAEGLLVAVGTAEIGVIGVQSAVAVLHPVHGLLSGSAAHIDADQRFGPNLAAKLDKIHSAELVAF